MCTGKDRSVPGERIDIRGLRLGMSVETADPVVLVVDGDEQDVGSLLSGGGQGAQEERAKAQHAGDLAGAAAETIHAA